jgi:carboxypeptidase Taq
MAMDAYRELETIFRRIGAIDEAERVLHWDMSVMMPPGGAAARTEQLAQLRVLSHEQLTAPRVGALFAAAEAERLPDPWQSANLREMRRRWRHASAVDSALVEAFSKACSRCEMIWREARPKGDFDSIAGALGKVLSLVREIAAAKADALGVSRYEALLDQFEPDGSTAAIDALFADLADFLPGFLDKVLARQRRLPAPVEPAGPFPVEDQRALAIELMRHLGFDFDHGRLDVSLHPFCSGVPDDVRITTRYNEDDFLEALMGVLHETGHALYERGLPPAWRLQPVGDARGMAVHESQSLLMEMQACRGGEFVAFAAPLICRAFGGGGPAWSAENLARLYTRVEPGFIRVDADEVTYPAQVILRYRLERAMIDGALEIADLPAAWNDGMRELLGVDVPDNRLGCLQDIHWFDGAFGYFPTYTLGALTAAQLFAAATAANSDIRPGIARGDFAPLLAWLRENVHGKGSLLDTDTLIRQATGAPLGTAAFKTHLERRYLA